MRITMDYGKSGLEIEVPDANLAGCLELNQLPALSDPQTAIHDALTSPIGTPPLVELARGKQSACILICDITRPVPNQTILDELLECLDQAGVPKSETLILISTGLHRPNEGDESIELVGERIAAKYRVENHFGQDLDSHTFLGESPRGVPVWIDSRYVNADLKIATGLIEPHFMAGYSGGRKVICPGVAAIETIKVTHGPRFLEHPEVISGSLNKNPVHIENTRIARMAGCDFITNVTLDKERQITSVVAGDLEEAYEAGIRIAQQQAVAQIDGPCDVVITSGAGYPLDTTFYQSIKGLVAALTIIKEGGTVINVSSMTEGIGSPEFTGLFDEHPTLDAFMDRILTDDDYFVMDQWQLEEMAKVARQVRVQYVTKGLSSDALDELYVESVESVEAAVSEAIDRYGPETRIAVIPKGPYVLPALAQK
ncbi:MAG: hypothetical protein CMJ78_24640 [Planctomycetaceae bacterium]|nr:hypothetical protein [Planctomycetaceae bacterium]